MTTNQVLAGVGLILVLAVGSQVQILFGTGLTRYDVGRRYVGGARITSRSADGPLPAGTDLLFLVRADGKLMPVTTASTPGLQSGDTMIVLESVFAGA